MSNSFSRSSGIILPLFSLPSPYGIGTLGKQAIEFADFLKKSGQSYWQMLPVGPTSYGDSPYQTFSSFAGNPYFIDLERLVDEKVLTTEELESFDWGDNPEKVDYEKIYNSRFKVLDIAFKRGFLKHRNDFEKFELKNESWLEDYALFMALKRHFNMHPWYEWEHDIKLHKPEAVAKYKKLLKEDVYFFKFIQYLFFRDWEELKSHCKNIGLKIIGDLPIYTALDSSDVWSQPEIFLLDSQRQPIEVAGVPPDYFSQTGQLWGNPLYRWDVMKKNGYKWWQERIRAQAKLFDVIRIDHFLGLESYWCVPFGNDTAINGTWRKGPSKDFVDMLKSNFPDLKFIAEDLGIITDEVRDLLKYGKFPGMSVLSFAFNPNHESDYLPHKIGKKTIVYSATHDNDTVCGWLSTLSEYDLDFISTYCGEKENLHLGVIRSGMASSASVFIAQIQDWLGKPSSDRTNAPGTFGANWQFRLKEDECTDELSKLILKYTRTFFRG